MLSQIPGRATEEGRQFAEDFQEQCDVEPSFSAASLAYACASCCIEAAQ